MSIADEIIRYISRNRVSTTEVADALGKSGVLSGISPLTSELHKVGRVHTIFTAYGSNHDVHDAIRFVEPDEIVLVFTHECDDKAIFGDLVAKYLLLYRQAAAVVVDGLVRDAARLRRERYPIWTRGVTPLGCVNSPAPCYPEEQAAAIRNRLQGGVAVCDDGGVVVIPPDRLNEEMLQALHHIELQEDLWYYCLNTLKWDTKRIVCDKEYRTVASPLFDQYADVVTGAAELFKKV
ncbi:MAG: RraA family protein [Magnetococcales bacterium]|nr:RraA family protein [Magnetococcales bacterium]MBF0115676.1 RraA family protein [Magnetococcales bacterium]